MKHTALFALVVAFFVLFSAMISSLLAASVAIGALVAWCSHLLITRRTPA